MPSLFLSPSVQEYNPYVNGLGSEEYFMNLVADAMEPYLISSGITFTRNNPDDTLSQAIALSNAGNYDFHLALHSNAAPASLAGQLRGPDVYYYTASREGYRAAQIFENNLRVIYPDPSLVNTVASTTLAELRLVRAPSNLIELAYHDNIQDATWIISNIDLIARTREFDTSFQTAHARYIGITPLAVNFFVKFYDFVSACWCLL